MMHKRGKYPNTFLLVSVLGLSAGLSGCFGGGGGDSNNAGDTGGDTGSSITNVTVGGTAAKGIVKNGIVTAEELDSSGNTIATVGSATTAADGTYGLTLNSNYTGGPIQISITTDANTQVKCDASSGCGTRTDGLTDSDAIIDFGEWYKPAALTMTALVPVAASNETLSVSVTPYTHMAASRARASATLDVAAVASANSEVSNLLGGIDILNTRPLDITDSAAVSGATSATEVTYAALASALSSQGLNDPVTGQPDLNAAIELLSNSFTAGIIAADDSGDADDDSQISLQEILTAALQTFTQAGIADITGVLTTLQTAVTNAETTGDGTVDPAPSTTVTDANLDKVKAMVRDVRTWGNVIELETQAKGSAFDAQVTMASDAVSFFGTDNLFNALGAAIDAALTFDGTPANLVDLVLLPVNDFTAGTISSPSAGVIAITGGEIYGYTVNVTLSLTLPADQSSISNLTVGIQSATLVSTQNSMTINSGLVNVTFNPAYIIDYTAIDLGTALIPTVTDLTFDLDASYTQNVDSTGAALTSPVSFAGAMLFDLDPVPVSNSVDGLALPKIINMSGTVSNTTGDSFDASLVVNISNTETVQFELFAPVNTLYSANHTAPFVEWTYTDTDTSSGIDTFTITSPEATVTIYWNAGTGEITQTVVYSDGSIFGGSPFGSFASFGDYLMTLPAPTDYSVWINGEGEYVASVVSADFSTDGTLDGTLVGPDLLGERAGNYIDADIGLTFSVQLTGLPEATVNITADRTGFEAGTGTMTISYGTRQLQVSANASNINALIPTVTGTVTITNQDSVVLTLSHSGMISGELSYNSTKYADVSETASGYMKIVYTDGTFEIF